VDDRNYYTQKLISSKSYTATTPENIAKFLSSDVKAS